MNLKRWTAWTTGLLCSLVSTLALADVLPERGGDNYKDGGSRWFPSYPRDVSLYGERIDWLINITAVFCIILFVIMCIWMVWACIAHNQDHEAEYDHGNSKHSVIMALGISAAIFFVVDGNLFYNSVKDLNEAFWDWEEASQGIKIEINAHQWAWDARYPGPDGEFCVKGDEVCDDIITLNDIRIPIDTPVYFQVASTDVIHSFYLPNFRAKQDATPGMVNHMWIQASSEKFQEQGRTTPQEFDIACAQHCGAHHYKMGGTLTVLSKEDYEAWAGHASQLNSRAYDKEDLDSHWGWSWESI